jgi:hypothetical protein
MGNGIENDWYLPDLLKKPPVYVIKKEEPYFFKAPHIFA